MTADICGQLDAAGKQGEKKRKRNIGIKQKVLKPLRFQDSNWSEWRDLNSRPLDPQSSALPTALHPDFSDVYAYRSQLVYINTGFIKKQYLKTFFFKKFLKQECRNTVDKVRPGMV